MKFLLPLILGLMGLGAGVGAGIYLHVPEDPEAQRAGEANPAAGEAATAGTHGSEPHGPDANASGEGSNAHDASGLDYIKLNNQFVVPLVKDGRVVSLIVMSLSLEVRPGNEETIYSREPKLRDAFLRVLFDHANAGGFSGDFTKSTNMMVLRDSLVEIARKTLGDIVTDVMITDLVRQDT